MQIHIISSACHNTLSHAGLSFMKGQARTMGLPGLACRAITKGLFANAQNLQILLSSILGSSLE